MKKNINFIVIGVIIFVNAVLLSGIAVNVQLSNSSEIRNDTQSRLMPAFCSKKAGCYA